MTGSRCGAACEVDRGGHHRLVRGGGARVTVHVDQAVGQPGPHRLRGVQRLTEQGHRRSDLGAHGALRQPRHATAGMDAQPQETRVEHRGRADQAQVAGQCQVEPCAHRGTVDGRDRGQRGVGDREKTGVDAVQVGLGARPACSGERVEVGPGAERGWRTGDHQGVYRLVAVERLDGLGQLVGQLKAQRVATSRIGHCQHHHAAPPLRMHSHARECVTGSGLRIPLTSVDNTTAETVRSTKSTVRSRSSAASRCAMPPARRCTMASAAPETV